MSYRYDDIKAACSCVDIATTLLGLKVENGRTSAVWRGSSDQNIAINETGFFDHANPGDSNQKGSIIDLTALVKFNGCTWSALNFLGEHLNLKPIKKEYVPSGHSQYDKLLADGYFEAVRYIYRDETGEAAHYVVRMEHPDAGKKKQFCQGANGRWGIKDTRLFPYNLTGFIGSDYVLICEGEKAAQCLIDKGLPGTTNSGGAGKWRAEYCDYFSGKNVVILRDNDEVGLSHANTIAKSLLGMSKNVFITTTSDDKKGDVFDYFAEGKTQKDLFGLIESLKPVTDSDLMEVKDIKDDGPEVVAAKQANEYNFRNFVLTDSVNDKTGKPCKERSPKHINKIVDEVHTRLLGFPRRVGADRLFDHDRDSHEIYELKNTDALFGWMTSKTGRIVEWAESMGMSRRGELFERLTADAPVYESISKVPTWPKRDDVFYAHEPLPAPDPGHKYFNEFVDFFNPTSKEFKVILKAFIMSPIFYKFMAQKPIWVIDSEVRGSGKTTLASVLAYLYNSNVTEIKPIDLKRNPQEVMKKLVAPMARSSKIVLIDNVTGVFKCDEFATLTTLPTLSERPAYGRCDEVRPNDLTYVIAANDPSFDDDIASRAYYFQLSRLVYSNSWGSRIIKFIESHRMNIFADILDILNSHDSEQYKDIVPMTRCPEVETLILRSVCSDLDEFNDVIKVLLGCKSAANSDRENASEFEDFIAHELRELGLSTGDNIWIRSTVAHEWFAATPGLSKNNGGSSSAMQTMRGFVKDGHATKLNIDRSAFPDRGKNRRRGVAWIGDSDSLKISYIVLKNGKKTTFITA